MNESKLFTVIIAHFNQLNLLQNAVNSVLCQKYPRIELVIADDCTEGFNEVNVRAEIKTAGTGVENIVISRNTSNLGTVASLNNAIMKSSGEYLLMFAADDALEDSTVLSKFAQGLDADRGAAAMFARCMEYDINLENIISDYYYPRDKSKELGKLCAKEQNERLSMGCLISIGATAFRRCELEAKPFNERYKYIEDWPLFLMLTRQGKALRYLDFVALRHRAGGVSRQGDTLSAAGRICNIEFVNILEREVLPYIKDMCLEAQTNIITRYEQALADTLSRIGAFEHLSYFKLFFMYPKLMLKRAIWKYVPLFVSYSKNIVVITVILLAAILFSKIVFGDKAQLISQVLFYTALIIDAFAAICIAIDTHLKNKTGAKNK
ncbi:MAG: glycosyltransferase [Oscillospiraceae bacterium]